VERVAERFRSVRDRAGIFLDFDGTLSDIVSRPELARPRPEASNVLSRLAREYAVVAVVSGRPAQDVRSLLGLDQIAVYGLYGLREGGPPPPGLREVKAAFLAAADDVEGAWVEDKGQSLAVHYRAAPDPRAAEEVLATRLAAVAARFGLALLPGKMVLELAPRDTPGKGAVITRECRSRGLEACLYAGDDRADLDAFSALDRMRDEGLTVAKVAVRSQETPREVVDAADVVVEGPAGLVQFLARL
jgi:trehalose 6-phosphate phosphatase